MRLGLLGLTTTLASWISAMQSSGQSYSLSRTVSYSLPSTSYLAFARPRGSGGDWTNDGIPDFAVHYVGGLQIGGRTRMYSGFDLTAALEWVGQPLFTPVGLWGVEQVGAGADFLDVDGDGEKEILLGTPEAFLGSLTGVGRMEAISPVSGSTLYTVWGEGANEGFGARVETVGDTSGNGVGDLLVYAESADGPTQVNLGAWYLIEGADGSVRQKYLASVPAGLNGPGAGFGDLDGDGLADIALSEQFANGGAGRVTIYSGYSTTTVIRQHDGTQPGWAYGLGAMFSLDDADADGVPDYVISAFEWGGGTAFSPGASWLYSGATGAVLATYVGPPGTGGLGIHGDRLDDIDGDGVDDLVLTAWTSPLPGPFPGQPGPGQMLIFSGLTGGLIQVISFPAAYMPPSGLASGFGHNPRNVGDIDGDGHPDFVAGWSLLFVYTRDIVDLAPNPVPIGSTATFNLSVPAQPGTPFHVLMSGSASAGIPLGTRVFPLDSDNVLLTTLLAPNLGGVLDSTGAASVSVPVPASAVLSGTNLFYTAVTLSPASPYGVRTIGNARTLTIQ